MGVSQTSIDIVEQIENYIRSSMLRKANRTGGIRLSINTIRMYRSLSLIWSEYLAFSSRSSILLKDFNREIIEGFSFWLIHHKKYALNYVGQLLKITKTIIRDAHKSGYEVHPYTAYIESFTQPSEHRRIITLTGDEIKQIESLSNLSPSLENHRRWMLIGLNVGQRVSDLLQLKPSKVRFAEVGVYVDLLQQKTDKHVTVGVVDKEVIEVLIKYFPYTITQQQFIKQLKIICQLARINQMVKGYKASDISKRRKVGVYPKYSIISSHDLRRSFAANYFGKIPTPILMQITGHSKESTFLSYIGAQVNKDVYADAFMKVAATL